MVRVPRNLINLKTEFRIPNYEKFNFSLETKWSDSMRDYGNNNSPKQGNNWVDVILDDYLVNNLAVDYNFFGYKAYFKIYNILDEKYNTALDYSGMERSVNFGMRKIY
jgi:outer membrane receptor protein involved in Fe transport